MLEPLPTIFLSHGAPVTVIEDTPARRFWVELGKEYEGVKAVLCISAHWETRRPAVGAVAQPQTIHDFSGFPAELYEIQYPAPGSPALAERAAGLLGKAGIQCDVDAARGIDHGTWVPTITMFPQAKVPVVQLSIQHHLDPALHLGLGAALEPLRHENVLVLGSGGAVHPLGFAPLGPGVKTDDWAKAFDVWLTGALARGDAESLLHFQDRAPFPERAHPRPDHYVPLLVALGAAGPRARGTLIHHSWYWGDLGMAAYRFNASSP